MGILDVSTNGIKVKVIAGQKNFDGAVSFSGILELKQHPSGAVYVSGKSGPIVYTITGYEWNGPEYKTVTTTQEKTVSNSVEHSRTKRTGRVTGALVGSLFNPAGAVIGAMVGTGNKKGKAYSTGTEKRTGTVTTEDQEIPSTAYMTLRNIKTNTSFTFSFQCDSKLNVDIQNMLHQAKLI